MKILHISNDFSRTKVHSMLYQELDKMGVEQTVFNPVRDAARVGRNSFEGQHTTIIYAHVVKSWHKYAYHLKRRHVFNEMLKRINPSEYSLTHATTLLTDGGLAYQLYKRYGIPYIVAVRSTDVNEFLKFMPHTWMDARMILLNAKKIIFINKGLRDDMAHHPAIRGIASKIEGKFMLMPNGINDYYLDHISHEPRIGHNIVYVGSFFTRKNVVRLAKAVLKLREQQHFSDCTLTLVGSGRADTDETERMIADYPEVFHFLGPIYEPAKMCEVFANARMFAMPSLHETFGLVYIEALSQNLPVLYTKGQGVDGLLPQSAGIAVNPYSIDNIANGLSALLTNEKAGNQEVDFEQFRWSKIAEKYKEIYQNLQTTNEH
jgi:glycosyltransferase involved in cell wall biosynthesis